MPNPFSKPQIPDEIVQAPGLNPQAQVIGKHYMQPTVANVAAVPNENQYEQLSRALGTLDPSFQQGVKLGAAKYTQAEIEQANAQWAESKSKLGDATRTGQIPPGQSQLFNDTWRSLDAQDAARRYQPALWQAWSQHPDASNPDKPQAFEQFRQQFRSDWNTSHLQDADTQHAKFTPHQLLTSKYNEILDTADQNLTTHNTNVRIDALTDKGKDTLHKNIQTTITQGMTNLDGSPMSPEHIDWGGMASSINESIRGQTNGLVTTGGLPQHLATEVTATAVAQAMMDRNDISIEPRLGAAMDKLDPAHPITGTSKWKSIIQTGREHVVAKQYANVLHRDAVDQLTVIGDTPEKRLEVYRDRDKIKQTELNNKKMYDDTLNSILGYYKPGEAMSRDAAAQMSDRLQKDMIDYRKRDPSGAMEIQKTLNAYSAKTNEQIMDKMHDANEIQFTNAIQDKPGDPDNAILLDIALRQGEIKKETWLRLRTANASMGQAAAKFGGVLSDPAYKSLEDGVAKASLKDASDLFGLGNIASTQATFDFRQQAIEYLNAHPKASAHELATEMVKHVEPTVFRYNATAKNTQTNRDNEARIQEQITQRMLTRDQANAIQKHDDQTFKNKNGETVTQTPEQTQQILKATEEQNAINKADATASRTFDELNTRLSPTNEKNFLAWKKTYASRDSGADYDLRGAFKAGLKPDPTTGHWPDTYKKPNHPTFSDQSIYKDHGDPGSWNGDTYVPGKKSQTSNQMQLPKEITKYLSGPTPEKLGEHMTTPEKQSVMESVRRAYEPGVKERPISQGVMRDQIREVLSRHYSNAHELNDVTNHLIEKLSAKYNKKR